MDCWRSLSDEVDLVKLVPGPLFEKEELVQVRNAFQFHIVLDDVIYGHPPLSLVICYHLIEHDIIGSNSGQEVLR